MFIGARLLFLRSMFLPRVNVPAALMSQTCPITTGRRGSCISGPMKVLEC